MKRRTAQTKFRASGFNIQSHFGGTARSTRISRQARPISSKQSMHVVLKSSFAKGDWSFRHPRNLKVVHLVIHRFCRRYGIKVFQRAVVGNHIHLLVKLPSREIYRRWVRGLSSAIVMAITGVNKKLNLNNRISSQVGLPRHNEIIKSFWDARPFTRVVHGLRGFIVAKNYVQLNEQDALGNVGYQVRRTRYLNPSDWLRILDWKSAEGFG